MHSSTPQDLKVFCSLASEVKGMLENPKPPKFPRSILKHPRFEKSGNRLSQLDGIEDMEEESKYDEGDDTDSEHAKNTQKCLNEKYI